MQGWRRFSTPAERSQLVEEEVKRRKRVAAQMKRNEEKLIRSIRGKLPKGVERLDEEKEKEKNAALEEEKLEITEDELNERECFLGYAWEDPLGPLFRVR